ncbi:MAG: phage holin family protein [Streptosporangiaceae bacterium]
MARTGRLVRAELRHAGVGAGLAGMLRLVAAYGVGALLIAAIAALTLPLPLWESAPIVGTALVAVAGALTLTGRDRVAQNINEIKERAHR